MKNVTSDKFERDAPEDRGGAEVRLQNSSRLQSQKYKIKVKKKRHLTAESSVLHFFDGMFHHLTFRLIASLWRGRSGQLRLWKNPQRRRFF